MKPKVARDGKRTRKRNVHKHACGKKIRYRDHAEAIEVLHHARQNTSPGKIPVRTYECNRCGGWHITSQA